MKLSPKYVKQKFNIDWTLAIILLLFFVVSITSITFAMPLVSFQGGFVTRQIMFYVTGFLISGFLVYFGTDNIFTLVKYAYWFLMFTLLLLVVDRAGIINVPFVQEVNGAWAWYQFPGLGSFQPSEYMKIALIIMVADIVSDHNSQKLESSYLDDIQLFLKVLKVAIPPLILIILQPDTGIPLIIIISIIAILCVSGIKRLWIYLGFGVVVGGFALFLFIFYTNQQLLINAFGDSLRLSRFYGWLETEKYILSYGNQLYQGLLAIGSAGLLGHPLNQVVVWFPEPQTDFIFSVIGQNFGFIGTTLVVVLSTMLDLKLFSIAYQNDNQRDKLVIMGFLGILVFQQVENMGMITGLLPITGITLPFISYGGSSLWSYMIPLAIVFKMSSDNIRKKGTFYS